MTVCCLDDVGYLPFISDLNVVLRCHFQRIWDYNPDATIGLRSIF